jgi:hypothetical protein
MATVIKPPSLIPFEDKRFKLFTAGSIDGGNCVEWAKQVEEKLKKHDIIIYNPRRDIWNPFLKQSANEPVFKEQVNWELDALNDSKMIIMYFHPGTMSPVSMLELGLHAHKGNLLVCCPEDFYRRGNIEIVCDRYGVTMVNDFEKFLDEIELIVSLSV